jgi:hypothetical protein
MHKRSTLNSEQAWSPKERSQNEWMYIDAGEEVEVQGLLCKVEAINQSMTLVKITQINTLLKLKWLTKR